MRRRPVALASSLGACTAAALILALGLVAESAATRRYVINQHLGSLLFALGFTPVGTLLGLRRPGNRISWLVGAIGAVAALALAADATALYLVQEQHVAPAMVAWLALIGHSLWIVPGWLAGTFLLLLFPTGQPPSRRWRPVAWISGAGLGVFMTGVAIDPVVLTDMLPGTDNPLAPAGAASVGVGLQGAAAAVLLAALLASAAAFLLRLWRSTSVERQQLKWVAYAFAMVVAGQLFGPAMQALGAEGNWVWIPLLLAIAGFPISIGIAILRYRLYDIDRLINRTLVYGLLTAVLGVVYASLVLVLGQLFGGLGTEPPSWVVAGATLAVAALFQPARRRIQAAVDRRFNRRKYNAAKTIEAFSTRLRDELDLNTLTAELLAVVEQTTEPTRVSLWLRPSRNGSSDTARGEAGQSTWAY
jgi:hypothetical protein